MRTNSLLLATHICAWSCTAVAQPTVDIGLYPGAPGFVELRITPDSDFSGLLSALSFTVGRTDDWSGRPMTLEQTDAMRQLVALGPSGGEHIVGAERYRIFSGIGTNTITSSGQVLRGGISHTIATFRTTHDDHLRIVNDDWAKDRKHNGAFYVSLNGLDRTGQVQDGPVLTDGVDGLSVRITPNPWSGGPLTVDVLGAGNGAVRIDLADAEGRTILSRTVAQNAPAFRSMIDPEASLAAGTYMISVTTRQAKKTLPLVVVRHGR